MSNTMNLPAYNSPAPRLDGLPMEIKLKVIEMAIPDKVEVEVRHDKHDGRVVENLV